MRLAGLVSSEMYEGEEFDHEEAKKGFFFF
jgi:hypothetical protein